MEFNQLMAMAGNPVSGAPSGIGGFGSTSGTLTDFAELQKAITASNYQTDVATLTGGGALGIQSLDKVMKVTVQENKHFTLFNRLQSTRASNIVDEYTRQNGIGGFLGGSTNTQMGVVQSADGDYSREIGYVKFLMTLRQVGYVGTLVDNIASPMAVEEMNGAKQLMTDAEYLLFHGNSDVCPTHFDGIYAQIDKTIAAGKMSSDAIYDLNGAALKSIDPFTRIGAVVAQYGNFGQSTDVYMPNSVQVDLNMGLDPAFRWSSQQGTTLNLGGHVEGIRLQNGVLKTNIDVFMHDESNPMVTPFEVKFPAAATANAAIKPASVTADASVSDASSRFTSTRAGNYYYAVAAISSTGKGLSEVVLTTQTAVAAGKKVTLTINRSSATTESGYAIYRSRQNGTNTLSDMRLVKMIKASGGATTTFTDNNLDLPGTVTVPVLNLTSSDDAIGWRQFQSMTKIPLPFGVGGVPVYSWFQFLFGYLRLAKPKHHGYIKNVLPEKQAWRPHVGE